MMKYLVSAFLVLLFAGTAALTSSCKKNKYTSKGNLEFSVDTLVFDTVFTTVGSTTGQFKVYNNDKRKLVIEEIELMGGASSPFMLNFDGLQGTQFSDITIGGKDSLFCFVEVTLGVNGGVNPLIVEDSVRFRTNGVDQYVKLAVWGQDAYFHYNDINSGVWPNDKPHVVYGVARVLEGQTLTIPAGTDVYLHKFSTVYVQNASLIVDGTAADKVTFRGDRLEAFYDDVPGQYYSAIYLDHAREVTVNYADIKNAIAGIHVESKDPDFPSFTTLTVRNTEISNCASYGMLLFDEPKVVAENTLIHSNGVHALIVLQGADMTFTHCDFLGYGTGDGTSAAVGIQNYYVDANGVQTNADINAAFNNCLVYGQAENQLVINTDLTGGPTINFNFRRCFLRTSDSSNPLYADCSFAGNVAFMNTTEKNFKRYSNSVLNNTGTSAFTLPTDILGMPRLSSPPDIGVYEF